MFMYATSNYSYKLLTTVINFNVIALEKYDSTCILDTDLNSTGGIDGSRDCLDP